MQKKNSGMTKTKLLVVTSPWGAENLNVLLFEYCLNLKLIT